MDPRSLTETMYDELQKLARHQLGSPGSTDTLQPTALVHEAWLRLANLAIVGESGRRSFYALAGKVMRSVLVDHARRKQARKRDSGQRITLETGFGADEENDWIDVLSLHEALERLTLIDPELVQVVELRFFAGLSEEETADVLERSPRTVRRAWRTARTWLRREIADTE